MMGRGNTKPNYRLSLDLELFYAIQSNLVTLSLSEFNNLPMRTSNHLVGFSMGVDALKAKSQKKDDAATQNVIRRMDGTIRG